MVHSNLNITGIKISKHLIYQESQFNPEAKLWMGAQGLMQFVPSTAEKFWATHILNPEQNIQAGTNYIKWLEEYWAEYIDNPSQLKKFVLASFNYRQGSCNGCNETYCG